ncbi:hypothetical protein ACMAZF_07725 [Psychrobium sp. nBUS_13]|uniref:hypothetical protein n=1 Tax=Psychrobium sp. nBUS_13 TaxID=3395319 RepID=UPI003EBE60D2
MVATKKQIILPILILLGTIAIAAAFVAMKEAPKEKEPKAFIPVVKTQTINVSELTMKVKSQGMVMAKEQTVLVAQVGGKITKLAPAFIRGGRVKADDVLYHLLNAINGIKPRSSLALPAMRQVIDAYSRAKEGKGEIDLTVFSALLNEQGLLGIVYWQAHWQ